MAVVAVTPTTLAIEVASADLPVTAGTAIVAGNTNTFAFPEQGKLMLLINNTYAGTKVATIKSGDFIASGQGDLEVSFAQDDVKFLFPKQDRHKDSSGNCNVTWPSGMTGYVLAFYVP